VFRNTEETKEYCLRQVHTLQRLNHKNIAKLVDYFDQDKFFTIIHPFHHPDLLTYLKTMNNIKEEQACHLITRLLQAISYCHSLGIVHGGLHPANVMVGGDTEKFNDLKVQMMHQEGDTKSCYVAPEVAGGKNYTQKSDMWAVGVIAYLVLTWRLD